MPHREPPRLATALRRAALRGLLLFAVVALALLVTPRTTTGVLTPPVTGADAVVRPGTGPAGAGDDAIGDLIRRHDCWTAGQPAAVPVPGHVVATRSGASRPSYLGAEEVGKALDQVFGGADHDLLVHAFCR